MIDKVGDKCIGCGACETACNIGCISLKPNQEGFLYPVLDFEKCIHCNQCEHVCPALSNSENYNIFESDIYGVKPKKEFEGVVFNSASAGVFYFLAKYFVDHQGYVFGAVFDENYEVKHVCVRSIEEISPMQNSKYVQSNIRTVYKQIASILNNNADAYVLFCGTPCQCVGLKTFLKRKYTNLLIVDIVCHGVPSPLAFKKYLNYLSRKIGEPTNDYQFRYKLKGWNYKGYMSSYVKYNDYYWPVVRDPYMSAFLKQLNYRECCYRCEYNTIKKCSDMTLADFVGIKNVAPDFFTPAGCSLVYIHNEKGLNYFGHIQSYLETLGLSQDMLSVFGKILTEQRKREPVRNSIYKDINSLSDEEYVKKRLSQAISFKSILRFYTPESIKKALRKINGLF